MNDTDTSLKDGRAEGLRLSVLTFGGGIFLGALLLFQVQPIIARFILPWFGGTTDVWTTCMLYFQVMLLAGYAYAHASATWLPPRAQAVLHLALVVGALALLPIVPAESWQPEGGAWPVPRILLILLATTGLPFFVLAGTSPLLQSWFIRVQHGRSPYKFYAVSNAGSLLALVSYPFVVEPLLGRVNQSWMWSGGVAVYAAIALICAVQVWLSKPEPAPATEAGPSPGAADAPPSLALRALWVLLPMTGSVLLLGSTNLICLDLAPVPFLWILPLVLYLLTFVICFHDRRWYRRGWMIGLLFGLTALMLAMRYSQGAMPVRLHVGAILLALFVGCMICHGEVYRLRPHARRLTRYYLSLSLGGALGGVLVAIVAPLVLTDYVEAYLALAACLALGAQLTSTRVRADTRWVLTALAGGVAVVVLIVPAYTTRGHDLQFRQRNFYGVLSVEQTADADVIMRIMRHGTTVHGYQFLAPPEGRAKPVCYYGPNSGAGLAMRVLAGQRNRAIGVIGLGTGNMAVYGRRGDHIRFYEINPMVQQLAQERFTYLADSAAETSVVMGDGRLALAAEPSGSLDLLIVDAFNSDAIPVHLLTEEAFAIYLDRLKPGGVLALHLTNKFLTLGPVALRLADQAGWPAYWVSSGGLAMQMKTTGEEPSQWVLVTKRDGVARDPFAHAALMSPPADLDGWPVWTDDHVHLLQAVGRP